MFATTPWHLNWSRQQDLNLRLLHSKWRTLTRLSYTEINWLRVTDSNCRSPGYEPVMLTTTPTRKKLLILEQASRFELDLIGWKPIVLPLTLHLLGGRPRIRTWLASDIGVTIRLSSRDSNLPFKIHEHRVDCSYLYENQIVKERCQKRH